MSEPGADRFQQAAKYASYLHTAEGRLRTDLGWANLRKFLPAGSGCKRALDVGGGTGMVALRLAELGFEVTLVDNSAAMLALARKELDATALGERISVRQGDAAHLSGFCESCSYDAVVCHNLLEWVEDPHEVLRNLVLMLKRDGQGMMSVLVRNRWGEVLKSAIKGRDLGLAEAMLHADTVLDSLYGQPVRVFDPAGLREVVRQVGLQLVAERGVRVLTDYIDCQITTADAYGQLLDFELTLGAQPQLAAIARYTQIIARHPESIVGR